uniref:Putative secreted protein n=1 Tax=Anopheles darlingi TaxID=43151 RepID=A0A2M4DPZ5_ANODA
MVRVLRLATLTVSICLPNRSASRALINTQTCGNISIAVCTSFCSSTSTRSSVPEPHRCLRKCWPVWLHSPSSTCGTVCSNSYSYGH